MCVHALFFSTCVKGTTHPISQSSDVVHIVLSLWTSKNVCLNKNTGCTSCCLTAQKQFSSNIYCLTHGQQRPVTLLRGYGNWTIFTWFDLALWHRILETKLFGLARCRLWTDTAPGLWLIRFPLEPRRMKTAEGHLSELVIAVQQLQPSDTICTGCADSWLSYSPVTSECRYLHKWKDNKTAL